MIKHTVVLLFLSNTDFTYIIMPMVWEIDLTIKKTIPISVLHFLTLNPFFSPVERRITTPVE